MPFFSCPNRPAAAVQERNLVKSDAELLHDYAETGSQEAFAELVRRHVGLVYATACRRLGGDTHLAQDVTQNVFSRLAQRAPSLLLHPTLAGWLYRTASNQAIDLVRTERRRREREANAMNETESPGFESADWRQLIPVVDEVIERLPSLDRSAILLRFLEGQPFPAVAAELQVSEPACRKRVARALDRMRVLLRRRGIASTAAALEAALSSMASVTTVPANIAPLVTANALMTPAGTGAVFQIVTFLTTSKATIGVLAGVLLLAAGIEAFAVVREGELMSALAGRTRANGYLKNEALRLEEEVDRSRQSRDPRERAGNANRRPTDPVTAGRKFLAAHAEAKPLLATLLKASLALDHVGLYQKLALTPAQIAQFEDILAQQKIQDTITFRTSEGVLLLPLGGSLSRREMDLQVRKLLGPRLYAQYTLYQRPHVISDLVRQFASSTALIDPISSKQSEELGDILLFSSNENYLNGADLANPNWDAVIAAARPILSPTQLDLLNAMKDPVAFNDEILSMNRPSSITASPATE